MTRCICADYAAITGALHPDCPVHRCAESPQEVFAQSMVRLVITGLEAIEKRLLASTLTREQSDVIRLVLYRLVRLAEERVS